MDDAPSSGYLSGKSLTEFSRQDLSALGPTDIAELSRRAFEKRSEQPCSYSDADADAGAGSVGVDSVQQAGGPLRRPPHLVPESGNRMQQLPEGGFTKEQFELRLQEDAEKGKAPMTGTQFRQQQALGGKPEMANTSTAPPSFDEFAHANYQHLMEKEEEARKANLPHEKALLPLSEEECLRLNALKDLDRSQMPAVADKDHDGLLVKTIEHYTFADNEDSVNFYVHFDKDLFLGAAALIQESQVKVESRATSLEIRVQGVPVSAKNADCLAEWRLTLSPLFGRVEASLTSHKMRNGKISIKLFKAKSGPWKKGVKYS